MWVRVLGSAAGGGFPQWNCSCPACRAVRDGSRPRRPRTQSSIAVSADRRALVPDQRLARRPAPRSRRSPGCTRVTAGRRRWRRCCSPTPSSTTRWGCCCCARRRGVRPARHAGECTRRCATAPAVLTALERYCPVRVAAGRPRRRRVAGRRAVLPGVRRAHHQAGPVRHRRGRRTAASSGYRLTDAATGRHAVYLPGVQELTPGGARRARRTATACSSTAPAGATTS